jgi:hypothetical protein
MTKDILEQFSSEQLLEFYKEKQALEEENKRKANKEKIEKLREERNKVTAEYKKQIAEIDRQIKVLGGKSTGGRKGRSSGDSSVSDKILELLKAAGPLSAKDIKSRLEADGVDVKYIHQKLAHLKRTNRVSTPNRGEYQVN